MERNLQIATSSFQPRPLALARIGPLLTAHSKAVTSLLNLLQEYLKMAAEIDALTTEVTETVGIIQSAVTLINGISARIQEAVDAALAANPGADLTPLVALTTDLNASSEALAAAVTANTPPPVV